MEKNEYLAFAKEICTEAGKIMKKYFYQDNGASYKGDKTIVTLADKEINHILIEKVKEKFPNHSVDGEEEKFGKSKYVWVCDPVDGTAMYARHIPVAVFSLALVVDGVPEVGVVYDPFLDKLYSAIKGQGAYCNDEKITVNDYKLEDERSISHFDMWPAAVYNVIPMLNELYQKTYFIGVGSIIRACMCVATGDFTCCVFPGTKGKNCDIAAVKVIVEEAGGRATDLFGNDQRYDEAINGALISNGIVHDELIKSAKENIQRREV